jgi:hypothetical protein
MRMIGVAPPALHCRQDFQQQAAARSVEHHANYRRLLDGLSHCLTCFRARELLELLLGLRIGLSAMLAISFSNGPLHVLSLLVT